MTSMVENLVKSYFNDNREKLFGEQASFVKYYPGRNVLNVRIAEVEHQLTFGCIIFSKNDGVESEFSNDTLLVKKFGTTNHELGLLPGFVTFALEVHFFQTVLPVLDQMTPTKQLFLKFCTSCTSATSTSNEAAILFKWPRRASCSFLLEGRSLYYSRCSVMLRKIAQFHARSLLLKRTQPDLVEDMNFACPSPGHFNAQLVLPMLTRCMEQLTQNHRCWRFAEGLSRFAQMLDNFDHRLKVPFARSFANEQCWVLCHQNYGQESVIFQLPVRNKFPLDLEIFNCQSMGFASLGVDMVIPLLVEPSESVRAINFKKLVRDYHKELQQAGCDVVVPSMECIETEIRSSVPFALYFLASRIIRANLGSQTENLLFKPDFWKEDKLLELCSYLITAELI